MKNFNTKKIIRALLIIACLAFSLFIGFIISINLIVDPIIYWFASTEGVRIFISCILSWLGVSTLFDLFYKHYRRSKKLKKFNALNIPYPRTFKGRK
jgi:Na+-driven multidrug efflux pump